MKWYNRKTMIPQKPVVDDFWTHDIPLFTGAFHYYRSKPRPVRGKIHTSEERYFDKHEIIPMTTRKGRQTYVMMHPYVFEPKMILTIGLYKKPKPYADQEPAIRETIGPAKQEGVDERQIGEAQGLVLP
jgi:hypothetical protein